MLPAYGVCAAKYCRESDRHGRCDAFASSLPVTAHMSLASIGSCITTRPARIIHFPQFRNRESRRDLPCSVPDLEFNGPETRSIG